MPRTALSNSSPSWNTARTLSQIPCFAAIENSLLALSASCLDWPNVDDLQAILDAAPTAVTNAQGARIRIARQGTAHGRGVQPYDARIYTEGVLSTRERNWHDLFNALVWARFPLAKAALNARQYRAGAALHARRNSIQDALTLLDECGVIAASCAPDLLALLRNFRWKELFWHKRERVRGEIEFCLFGHGLMEQMLHPYAGLTGKAVLLEVPSAVLGLPFDARMRRLDGLLAAFVERDLGTARDLAPLPVLGVPGWAPGNGHPSFYDNTAYFRPGRSAARSSQ